MGNACQTEDSGCDAFIRQPDTDITVGDREEDNSMDAKKDAEPLPAEVVEEIEKPPQRLKQATEPLTAEDEIDLTMTTTGIGYMCSAIILAFAVSISTVLLQHPPEVALVLSKPHITFDTFYNQTYLAQHSKPATKLLHFAGSLIAVLLVGREPRLVAAAAVAATVGLGLFRLCLNLEHGAVEFGGMAVTFLLASRMLTGKVNLAVLAVLCGYSFAWVAHFFVENNKPATFIYPTFSLFGDFRMMAELLAGKFGDITWGSTFAPG